MTVQPSDNKKSATARKPVGKKTLKADGPCPIMRACGGCEWLNLPYKKQLARKQASMNELFGPLLEGFGWSVAVEPIVAMGALPGEAPAAEGRLASPRAFRYKAATPFAPGPRGGVQSGFYARGTHDIVPCSACAVEARGTRRILNETARLAGEFGISAYDEDRARGLLRHAVVRMGWKTGETMLTVVTSQKSVPHLQELVDELRAAEPLLVCAAQNINPRRTNAILGGETRALTEREGMRDELLGCAFEISPTAFYQTNPAQTETLYRLAIEGMALVDGDVLIDAYCGSGTIGICAARAAAEQNKAVRVIGVERNASGVQDARANAQLNGLQESCRFVCDDAAHYLERVAAEGERVDVLVLDPPRAGSTERFLAAAGEVAPRRVVYISCNPATQARDIEVLGRGGYALERLVPVDMFPHTGHVETVAVLTR